MSAEAPAKPADNMNITPPFAYGEIVPLNKNHRVLVPQRGRIAPAFRSLNALPISLVEFPLVARDYPIVFVTADNGKSYAVFAVLGLEAQSNLFLMSDNTWDRRSYLPAYVRRYPFVFANDDANKQMVLCIDRNAEFIVESGYDMPFFDEKGEPTEYTKNCIEFCNNFEVERQRTVSFVQLLKDNDLFETKKATFTPTNPDGTAAEPQIIAEYFGVSEEKLNGLSHAKLAELRDNGALGQIYAHLLSLVGLDRLVAVAMSRAAVAANA